MAARVKIINPRCTCRERLGMLQAAFNTRISQGEGPVEAVENLDCTLLCCRMNMLYPTTFPVTDANAGCFVDDVGLKSNRPEIENGRPLYMEGVPKFPNFK